MTQNKQSYGLDGHVTSDVIEIPHGENLLGFDSHEALNSGAGWVSIANRSGRSIFLHTTPDLILLSFVDLDGCEVWVGKIPEESSMILQPLSDSEKREPASASLTLSTTSECPSKQLENSLDSISLTSQRKNKPKSNGTPTVKET